LSSFTLLYAALLGFHNPKQSLLDPLASNYTLLVNELIKRSIARKKAIKNEPVYVLTKNNQLTMAQFKDSSETVKASLVKIVLKLTARMANSSTLSARDVNRLAKLTDIAQKLFAWPSAKPMDQNQLTLNNIASGAINVALIRTTPEQLRAKAKEIATSQNSSLAN
jgi:flagellar motor protein MotB